MERDISCRNSERAHYNMEIVFWNGDSVRPLFILNEGVTNRASTFERSLQVGKALDAAPVDGDYTLFEGFNYIRVKRYPQIFNRQYSIFN
jgi:hypothetical protein